ncbi:hypothetical protein QEZ52_04640 [Aliisedimentitalea scapharcae]|uniref:Arylsulfatase n=1 Tax=Aliisedimentitalea scapharcae TaxID=1524259 RepID=A0ABZ2XYW9_9RHOB
MPDLTLLHTADVHCATFDRLAPTADLHHIVRPDWLTRAQTQIDTALRNEVTKAVTTAKGPVLCSCTTIGEVAEAAGATRIDWPMMQRAAQIGAPVLMAYCLDSTLAPSQALLQRAFGQRDPHLSLLDLSHLWGMFVAGQTTDFAVAIAQAVDEAVHDRSNGCVVLAQASMAQAAGLAHCTRHTPVLSSPDLAIKALLPVRATKRF